MVVLATPIHIIALAHLKQCETYNFEALPADFTEKQRIGVSRFLEVHKFLQSINYVSRMIHAEFRGSLVSA